MWSQEATDRTFSHGLLIFLPAIFLPHPGGDRKPVGRGSHRIWFWSEARQNAKRRKSDRWPRARARSCVAGDIEGRPDCACWRLLRFQVLMSAGALCRPCARGCLFSFSCPPVRLQLRTGAPSVISGSRHILSLSRLRWVNVFIRMFIRLRAIAALVVVCRGFGLCGSVRSPAELVGFRAWLGRRYRPALVTPRLMLVTF